MIQRIRDWLRERRLRAIQAAYTAAVEAQQRDEAVRAWRDYQREHAQRSAMQVARMERRMFR